MLHWIRWPMRLALLLSATGSFVLTLESFRGEEGWPRRKALSDEVANVARDIAALELQSKQLQRQIVAERERTEVQEALVRDLLGYLRPEDVVLRGSPQP